MIGGAGCRRADRRRRALRSGAEPQRPRQRRAPATVEPARELTTARRDGAGGERGRRGDWSWRTWRSSPTRASPTRTSSSGRSSRRRNQPAEARDAFRKYLELAPLGTHAAEARKALDRAAAMTATRPPFSEPAARCADLAGALRRRRARAARVDRGRAGRRSARRRARHPRRGRAPPPRQPRRGAAAADDAALRDRAVEQRRHARSPASTRPGMSPLAGPVAAAAVIFAPRDADPGGRRLEAPRRRDARAAGADHPRARGRLGGRVRRGRRDRLHQHLLGRAGGDAARDRGAVAGRRASADRRPPAARRALPQQPIVKGDTKSLSIAAASILAKTARDARMRALDAEYPGYGFAQHKGYPVPAHVRALRRLGPCPVHRRSFALVREALGLPPLPPWPERSAPRRVPMTRASDTTWSPRSRPAAPTSSSRRRSSRASRARTHKRSHAVTSTYPVALDNRCRAKLRRNFGGGVSAVDDDATRDTMKVGPDMTQTRQGLSPGALRRSDRIARFDGRGRLYARAIDLSRDRRPRRLRRVVPDRDRRSLHAAAARRTAHRARARRARDGARARRSGWRSRSRASKPAARRRSTT